MKNERILNSDEKCFQIWKNLKKILITIFTLNFFDFFRSFILYVDENKKKIWNDFLSNKQKWRETIDSVFVQIIDKREKKLLNDKIKSSSADLNIHQTVAIL